MAGLPVRLAGHRRAEALDPRDPAAGQARRRRDPGSRPTAASPRSRPACSRTFSTWSATSWARPRAPPASTSSMRYRPRPSTRPPGPTLSLRTSWPMPIRPRSRVPARWPRGGLRRPRASGPCSSRRAGGKPVPVLGWLQERAGLPDADRRPPDQYAQLLLGAVLSAIEGVAEAALDLAKAVVNSLCAAIDELIDWLTTALTTPGRSPTSRRSTRPGSRPDRNFLLSTSSA